MVQDWSAYIDTGTLGWVQALNSTAQQQQAVPNIGDAAGQGQTDPFAAQRRQTQIQQGNEAANLYSSEMAALPYNPVIEWQNLARQIADEQRQNQAVSQIQDVYPQTGPTQTISPANVFSPLSQRDPTNYRVASEDQTPLALRQIGGPVGAGLETASGFLGDVGEAVGRSSTPLLNLAGIDIGGQAGRFIGESVVPRTGLEIAAELTPLGFAGDAVRGARRLTPEVQDVIRRGGRNLLDRAGYLYPEVDPTDFLHGTTARRIPSIQEEGLRPGSWLTPNRGTAENVARNQALLRGDSPMLLDVQTQPGQIERARTTFARRPAYRLTENVAPSGQTSIGQGLPQRLLGEEAGFAKVPGDRPRGLQPEEITQLAEPGGRLIRDLPSGGSVDFLRNNAGQIDVEFSGEPGLAGFREIAQHIDEVRQAYPDAELIAVAADARRTRVFEQAGFLRREPFLGGEPVLEFPPGQPFRGGTSRPRGLQPEDPGYRRPQTLADLEANEGSLFDVAEQEATMFGEGSPGAPARYVTQPDGGRVAPNPEAIKSAVERFLARPSVRKNLDWDKLANDPETFGNELVDNIVNANTKGGAKLMEGVAPEEVQQAIMEMGDTLDSVVAVRQASTGGGGITPPPPEAAVSGVPDGMAENVVTYVPIRKESPLEELGNVMRGSAAGADISFGLRQGGLNIRHGKEVLRSLTSGWRALGDEEYAFRRFAEMAEKDRKDLFLSEIPGSNISPNLSVAEENYASKVANLPVYKQTGRANVTILNEQRVGIYDLVEEAWRRADENGGVVNKLFRRDDDLEALSRYINRTTGRGTLGPAEGTLLSELLGIGLFSPRYLVSRPQALLNLVNLKNPRVAVEAWKDFGFFVGATSALLGLAAESGLADDVNLDPRSADFGKFRMGDVRIDPWLGFQQIARYSALIAEGAWDGNWDELADVAERFARTKLAPLPSTIYDLTRGEGENLIGEKVTAKSLGTGLLPIWVQGMVEYAIEGESGLAKKSAILAPFEFFGAGVQVYESLGDARDKVSQELYGKPYRELTRDLKLEVDGDPRTIKRASDVTLANIKVRAEYEDKAFEVDRQMQSGDLTGSDARIAYGKLLQELSNNKVTADFKQRPYNELTDPEKAERDYYAIFDLPEIEDPVTGEFDFEVYGKAVEEWQKQWPQFSKEEISPDRPLSEGHAELLEDRKVITDSGWWNAHQWGFEYVKQTASPDVQQQIAQYETYDEFRDEALRYYRNEKGLGEDQAEDAFFKLSNDLGLNEQINKAQGIVLSKQPDIIPLLAKWGYTDLDGDSVEVKIARELVGAK